jgi:hypothetical protein
VIGLHITNLFNKFVFLFGRERAFTARAHMMSTGNSFKRIKHLPHTICNIVLAAGDTPYPILVSS